MSNDMPWLKLKGPILGINDAQADEYLDVKDLASWLKMDSGRIRYEVFKSRSPYIKIGRSLRFSKKDIDLWIQSQKRGENG